MPSRYQKILPLIVFGAAILLCVGVGYKTLHQSHDGAPIIATTTASAPLATTSLQTSSPAPAPTETPARTAPSAAAPASAAAPIPDNYEHATLTVSGTTYDLAAPQDSTIEAAMNLLKLQNPAFTFSESEYPGLGQFVDSINGKANTSGNYWFLYVNGKESTTGISQTILHSGDTIEWKYEHA